MELFNGRLRDEGLNTHWFLSLEDARAKIEAWRRDYNESRPHPLLGGTAQGSSGAQHRCKGGGGSLTPMEYATAAAKIVAKFRILTFRLDDKPGDPQHDITLFSLNLNLQVYAVVSNQVAHSSLVKGPVDVCWRRGSR